MVIQKLHNHPELIIRHDALLCSINDRLAGGAGTDFEPLSMDFILDTVDLQLQEVKLMEDQEDLGPVYDNRLKQEARWQEFKL